MRRQRDEGPSRPLTVPKRTQVRRPLWHALGYPSPDTCVDGPGCENTIGTCIASIGPEWILVTGLTPPAPEGPGHQPPRDTSKPPRACLLQAGPFLLDPLRISNLEEGLTAEKLVFCSPNSQFAISSLPHATPSAAGLSCTGLGTTTPRTTQACATVSVRPPRSFSTLPSTTRGRPEVMREPKRA